jgi:hypothetical protein
MAHDVFVSHSAKDKPTADAVCAALEGQGIRCWVAPRDIVPGKDWGEAIVDAIKGARVMVLIFSTHANASQQIKREVERAVSKGIPVIPLRIEAIEPTASLEYFLSTPHWLDAFTPPLEKHLRYLAKIVNSIIAGEQPSIVSPRPGVDAQAGAADRMKGAPAVSTTSAPARKITKLQLYVAGIGMIVLAGLAGVYCGVFLPRQGKLTAIPPPAPPPPTNETIHIPEVTTAKPEADVVTLPEMNRPPVVKVANVAVLPVTNSSPVIKAADVRISAPLTNGAAHVPEVASINTPAVSDVVVPPEPTPAPVILVAKTQTPAPVKNETPKVAEITARETEAFTSAPVTPTIHADTNSVSIQPVAKLSEKLETKINTPTQSGPLTKLSLADFSELFGLKSTAKPDDVRAVFGNPNSENITGGISHDQNLVWIYKAGGPEDLKITFDNGTKVIRDIIFNEDHVAWLGAHGVSDRKLSLMGMPSSAIEKLIGRPTEDYLSTLYYRADKLDVEFLCAEHNRFKCSRIEVTWSHE